MTSALEQLKKMTVVVADTGELSAVQRYQPIDCTTNPSLVLEVLKSPESEDLVAKEMERCQNAGMHPSDTAATLTVAVGAELAKLIPGRVSTEVDARLSFDIKASVQRAREIIHDYADRGVGEHRILIKLAATWEGIRAAEILQGEGIDCNLTLLFSMAQAIASADAGAFLISPFVGRITDWHKKALGKDSFEIGDDPGVRSVQQIYSYYKSRKISTIVMGASFRNTDQIKALAGCDRLTISPKLLEELSQDNSELPRALHPENHADSSSVAMDEAAFRWEMNSDAMATEKLAEGIRNFDADYRALIKLIEAKLNGEST